MTLLSAFYRFMSRSRSGGMLLKWPCGWQGGTSLRAERGLLLGRRSEQVDKSRAASNPGPRASRISKHCGVRQDLSSLTLQRGLR